MHQMMPAECSYPPEHDGTEFPIAFLLHTSLETQRKWSVTEQEVYGAYYAITK